MSNNSLIIRFSINKINIFAINSTFIIDNQVFYSTLFDPKIYLKYLISNKILLRI
jgi:hypothetical protein